MGSVEVGTISGFSPESKEIISYVKLWIHAVWGTKNHERILSKDVRHKLFQHIHENANSYPTINRGVNSVSVIMMNLIFLF